MNRNFGFEADLSAQTATGFQDDRVGLSELFAILRRRQATVTATLLLTIAAVVAFVLTSPPAFEARAVVMVPPALQYDDPATMPTRASSEDEIRINTTVELLKSPKIVEELARVLSQELDHFEQAPQSHVEVSENPQANVQNASAISDKSVAGVDPALSLDSLNESLAKTNDVSQFTINKIREQTEIRRVSGSRLIEILVTANTPDLAAKMANGLPEIYSSIRRADYKRERKRKIDRLEDQIEDAEIKVYEQNVAVAKFMRENNLLGPQASQSFQNRVSALEMTIANTQAESASRRLNELLGEQRALQSRLAELQVTYGPGYPEIIGAQQQLIDIGLRIEQERQLAAGNSDARRSEFDAAASALAGEVRSIRRKQFEDMEANARLSELERNAQAASDLLDALLLRLSRAKSESFVDVAGVEFVTRAVEPTDSNAAENAKRVIVGMLGACFVALLAAMIAEGLDNKVRSSDHIRAFLRAPTLAMIPKVNSRRVAPTAMQGYIEKNPESDFAEAIRNLYLELMSQKSGLKQRVVVITSVKQGDGKTTIANGLAAVAEAFDVPSKVIEFDRNFQYGPPEMKSGVEVDARAEPAEATSQSKQMTPVQPAVIRPLEESEWRGEAAPLLPRQLIDMTDRWSLIIVEAPPILRSRDAKALAANATDVIVVVEWGAVTPGALKAIRKAFGRVEIGAVINRVNMRAHARRGYGDSIDYASRYA
ncbi:MAG: Wzz/FepE/Etk N-terminal domain-containing protein [Parvularculaceae bacterium]|nr:Wzz/FepE/Etk N-terminal domain-containing protein [Parvularculaceae bacterium]